MYNKTSAVSGTDSNGTAENVTKSFVASARNANGPLLGIALSIQSSTTAQVAGLSGADFAFIDMEHSPLSAENATQMVQAVVAASRGTCYPLIRVPSHGVEWIKWALDSGAAGIIIPMVDSAEEMQQIIDRAMYPPAGRRSFGPMFAAFGNPEGPQSGGAGYMARVSRGDIAILPMIESKEGLENAEAIMSVDGVSGVFIGPYDLRLALGLPGGQDGKEPEFLAAMAKIHQLGQKLDRVIGTMAIGQETLRRCTSDGTNFVISSSDYSALGSGFSQELAEARTTIKSIE